MYPFTDDVKKLKFQHNISPVLGFGGAYKWFSLRLSFALKGTSRSVSRYGKSTYFDIGTQFQVRKWFFTIDLRSYQGYAIKDAFRWNDTLNKLLPNDIRKNTQTASFSLNSWYFFKKNFNMSSVFGRTGHYEKALGTVYLKPTLSIHGVGNNNASIIPVDLVNLGDDKTSAHSYAAFDFGLVPGYAYVNRIKNWQFCGFIGLGGVVQTKFYANTSTNRGFLGLAPRYDLKIYGGYSIPKYFAFMSLDFDNKSIRYNTLRYKQNYFTFRITAGIRLDKKEKSKR